MHRFLAPTATIRVTFRSFPRDVGGRASNLFRATGVPARHLRGMGVPARHPRGTGVPARYPRGMGVPARHLRGMGVPAVSPAEAGAQPFSLFPKRRPEVTKGRHPAFRGTPTGRPAHNHSIPTVCNQKDTGHAQGPSWERQKKSLPFATHPP
jgi:hypothetical protein